MGSISTSYEADSCTFNSDGSVPRRVQDTLREVTNPPTPPAQVPEPLHPNPQPQTNCEQTGKRARDMERVYDTYQTVPRRSASEPHSRKGTGLYCGSRLRKGEVFACVGLSRNLKDLNPGCDCQWESPPYAACQTTRGPLWGYLKSQFSRDLVKFWR